MDLISTLKQKDSFISLSGADDFSIKAAEKQLGLKFYPEYREYLSSLGAATYYGHELTGISNAPAIDVVQVTESERSFVENVPQNWYVIERLDIDGISIWQDSLTGKIYRTSPNTVPVEICDSLLKYVECD